MSRHLAAVATSTLNQKQSRQQLARKLKSRHQSEVATAVVKTRCCDIIWLSRHQLRRLEVATSLSCRDIHCKGFKVATSAASKSRSRHQPVVVTSHTRKAGPDMIQLSRHQLLRIKVATSVSGRDIRYTDQKVAT